MRATELINAREMGQEPKCLAQDSCKWKSVSLSQEIDLQLVPWEMPGDFSFLDAYKDLGAFL